MASSIPSCGPCDTQHISKPSIAWCTLCDKGLCLECKKHPTVSTASRNHNTLPISEYQELARDVQQITENCDKHNEKYTIYCKKHESPCCGSCFVEDHIDCRDFSRLKDIIDRTKNQSLQTKLSNRYQKIYKEFDRIERTTCRIYPRKGVILKKK
ncbi:unnamed protein product [Mytilus coruscus]|uniref:Uncharacterized protein n=1 Tax=Mytilus coruscus TaxID=42192 RepID=A0A6J8BZR9_MYTCO|nr:unnamed protein product [Mytilus coruscus]